MDSLIETFHLDVKGIIAQLVNFAIVFGVLYFFALKPLTKLMRERTAKIEKGLKDAKDAETKLQESAAEKEKVLNEAKKQSLAVLEEAGKKAEAERQETIAKTKKEVESIVLKGKQQLAAEKVKMVTDAKAELGNLVASATEKILGQGLTKEIDEKLSKNIIKNTSL
ncbi:MAG: F0F1 ATP synthase subunit B [Patescibacteria group bacterium]|jgi:F-type H+-transporting ATPase subunit b